jgi:hypothetical protein
MENRAAPIDFGMAGLRFRNLAHAGIRLVGSVDWG